jgi:FtsH-binding integral membrane protein
MNESYQQGQAAMHMPGMAAAARSVFIARTYNHLLGAIVGFTLLEFFLFQTGMAETIARTLLGVNWLIVLGGFILVSWLASRFAHTSSSLGVQYMALTGFVVAEAIIFVPLLFMANHYAPGAIQSAATVTLVGFAGLTGIAFWTRKDFSFMRAVLPWLGMVALLAIVGSVIFGFHLGTWFSVAMIGLAGGAILYDTSNIIHHFPEDRYVGAALELFASVALMFWYVLRLFVSRD